MRSPVVASIITMRAIDGMARPGEPPKRDASDPMRIGARLRSEGKVSPYLSQRGHPTGYHRVAMVPSRKISPRPRDIPRMILHRIRARSTDALQRSTPREPFKFSSARANTSVFPRSEPPAIGRRPRGRRMCDSTHLTELGRNAVRKLAHVFRTSHRGGKYRMGFGGLLLRCFCDLARSRVPLFLPPPRGKRPARPPPLAAVSRWPPWGSRGLQRWWWMISSPLPRASWYA